MLEDGLSYPVRGDWIGRVIIGGVLGFFSWLVIPGFLLLGYLVEVLESTVAGSDTPPEFTDWGTLLVRGIVATVIGLAYTLLPMIAYGVFVVLVIGTGGAIGGDAGALIGGLGLLAALGFLPVIFVVYYAVPAALTAYAVEGNAKAAFDPSLLKPTLLSVEYLVAVLMPLVVTFVLWIATGVLAVTIVGLLLVPFLQFYGQVAVFRMFGTAFADQSDRLSTPGSAVDDATETIP
ncbi:DUF4013 domain-containing protein [Halorubrum sp. JWXQ-INN 858]|uniref:DUF4013 domain-containing protein n=1 Tax=Halorubrum sp. JWXQ-INN 858 TaxID=2690782 RepID=UPI00135719D9|nr:DUF4013 domain-containing protein [Halorubrum sp. JWXQ-INN 858]MWV64764.1 DUF4013 domain-containing protein [Halorubrum sp. JWXQ-INN 858]